MKELTDSSKETYKMFMVFDNQRLCLYQIVRFKQRYSKNTKYKITLSDLILAFKLSDNANLNHQQQQP